jgi:hypothetical protein
MLLEWVLVPLASTTGLQVKVAIVGNGSKFLIGGGAAMERSLAKLAQMAATQTEKPFLATWWAQSALRCMRNGFIGSNLAFLLGHLVGQFLAWIFLRPGPMGWVGFKVCWYIKPFSWSFFWICR